MTSLLECRICKNTNLVDVIDLGNHKLSSRFPRDIFEIIPNGSLILTKCSGKNVCNLVQLKHTIDSSEMYFHEYGYRSGINTTMREHLYSISKYIEEKYNIEYEDVILDIGSNDATLLKSYPENLQLKLIGIDPTSEQFKEYYPENIIRVSDYFSEEVYQSTLFGNLKPKIITSLSMFYDLPEPLEFMRNIKSILREDGVWVIEQSYLPTMIENLSFDTICHEHLEYYCLEQIQWMVSRTGLKIIDVSLNDCNGGSFRVFMTHVENDIYDSVSGTENIERLVRLEKKLDINNNNLLYFSDFMKKCDDIKKIIIKFLTFQKECGKIICIYGASTKGNTLLQYFGIDNKLINCISERNVNKYGKYTPGTNIPIVSEEEVRLLNPDFMLVLPWHFKKEFLLREQDYLNNGGQFIFPLPYIDIVSNYKKVLITGITGQIGTYLTNELKKEQNILIYGVVNKTKPLIIEKNIFYLEYNLLEYKSIENIISMLFRNGTNHQIYNLAGITDSRLSIVQPVLTFELNIIVPLRICQTIVDLNLNSSIKLFQACSSEMYKGDRIGTITPTNKQYNPTNPYGISKITSAYTLDYYKKYHNIFCCYGIIFNTESSLRNKKFLTQKVCSNIIQRKFSQDTVPLDIGQIETYRDWIHAEDVSSACVLIMNNSVPDNYVISLGAVNSVKEFINISFKLGLDIDLIWDENGAYNSSGNNEKIVNINIPTFELKFDNNIEMLTGDNSKLISIGWKPKYNLENIILEILK